MDDLTKGTWIINSLKQINRIRTDAPELEYFEATQLSGKAGNLLSRLVADEEEIVPAPKVKAFARESGISKWELIATLSHLRDLGKTDFSVDKSGELQGVEVYSFSIQDAIHTTRNLYERLNPSEHEEASLLSLHSTFHIPQFQSELVDQLTTSGFSEKTAITTLRLQESLELIRTLKETPQTLFYNEHAFSGDPAKIAKALKGLSAHERKIVQDIQDLVGNTPGYSYDLLLQKFPQDMVKLIDGVGLIDTLTVYSDFGKAAFVTLPQQKGIAIGNMPPLSSDVFHKAKVLLSCLRFGEVKSEHWRGRIDSTDKMLNIVNKLVRGDWVGPATAIGEDYQLLEKDGVIVTQPDKYGMYRMMLRQKEVGLLVKQMLEFNRAFPEIDIELQQLLDKQPTAYMIPEHRRSELLAQQTKPVKEAQERLLHAIRT